jgi:hypothetical protein
MSIKHLLAAASFLAFGLVSAHAQEGVTYQSFTGQLFVRDNPTNDNCQAAGIVFATVFRVVYRFTIQPNSVTDALAISSDYGASQMYSTQSPNFSLNGPSTTGWNYIDKYANVGTFGPSSSNLTIQAGLTGLPPAAGNANIIINGSINDFVGIPGCNIASVHAALARNPD